MLRVKIHKGIRHMVHLLHCRYRVDNMQLNMKRLNARFYNDHLLANTKSLEGNTGARIYTTGKFKVAYPCTNHSEVGDTLQQFTDDVGIPDRLRSDMAPEILGKIWILRIK